MNKNLELVRYFRHILSQKMIKNLPTVVKSLRAQDFRMRKVQTTRGGEASKRFGEISFIGGITMALPTAAWDNTICDFATFLLLMARNYEHANTSRVVSG